MDIRAAKGQKELLGRMKSLKMGHNGHVVRKYNRLEKEVIQGCTSGCRSRGDISERNNGREINNAARVAEDGDLFCAPPTLRMEDGTRRRRMRVYRVWREPCLLLDR